MGFYWNNLICKIYRNDSSGVFTDIDAGLPRLGACRLAWGDYDKDGDLDLAHAGYEDWGNDIYITTIYRNDGKAFNTAPDSPVNLALNLSGTVATLEWDASSDTQTPFDGLSYNIRVGTTPGGDEIYSGMADNSGTATDGYRRLAQRGMIQDVGLSKIQHTINGLPSGTYYWSVQAIDSALAGSAWVTEQTFTVP